MSNQELEEGKISIQPTALAITNQYTDISLTNLIGLHVNQVNSERQAIWQRYTAMLVANSILFIFSRNGNRDAIDVFFGILVGIVLCIFWIWITLIGWEIFDMRWRSSMKFEWEKLSEKAHPFNVSIQYHEKFKGDIIKKISVWVICIFIAGYVYVGIRAFL